MLTLAEQGFLAALHSLSTPALTLYIRLANRKGPYFRVAKLDYLAADVLQDAITELQHKNIVTRFTLNSKQHTAFLNCFTHSELCTALAQFSAPRFAQKSQLLAWLPSWPQYGDFMTYLCEQHPAITLSCQNCWPFFKFLFFGELRDNLADFVIHAIGHIQGEAICQTTLAPRFTDRQAAHDSYRLACLYAEFRIRREADTAIVVHRWWQAQNINRMQLHLTAHDLYDRLIARLGRRLERDQHYAAAMQLYQQSPVAPARERLARLYIKFGEKAVALALCVEMLHTPSHAEEAYAAQQLYNRLTKTAKRSAAANLLKDSDTLVLDYQDVNVEAALLQHYAAQGWYGVHSENWLWNCLFGLVFWDIIYDASYGMFNQPMQLAPHDLYTAAFYPRRADAIEKRLQHINHAAALLELLNANYAAKQGTHNPFVGWHDGLLGLLETMAQKLPWPGLTAILRFKAQDIKRRRRGFPDLFIWHETAYAFVEVKSANDHLLPQQYNWLNFFNDNNVTSYIQRVVKPGT